ncbi:MAG: hypothetical protein IPL32_18545 [Chloracidobacterium sp.]|nr:hypothetical protein [Chloracidobacterium sp.]
MANTPVTSIRLPDDVREWADRKAADQDRSRAYVIVQVLRNVMSGENESPAKERKRR